MWRKRFDVEVAPQNSEHTFRKTFRSQENGWRSMRRCVSDLPFSALLIPLLDSYSIPPCPLSFNLNLHRCLKSFNPYKPLIRVIAIGPSISSNLLAFFWFWDSEQLNTICYMQSHHCHKRDYLGHLSICSSTKWYIGNLGMDCASETYYSGVAQSTGAVWMLGPLSSFWPCLLCGSERSWGHTKAAASAFQDRHCTCDRPLNRPCKGRGAVLPHPRISLQG